MDDSTVEIEDDAIREGFFWPYQESELSKEQLVEETQLDAALGARSLIDLVHFPNLGDLYLNWSCVEDYSAIAEVGHKLKWVEINCSTISDLRFLDRCPNVWAIDLRFSHIEDLSPLLEHENLENLSIDVRGNPLSEESFYEILPALEERASNVRSIDEDVWKLQRRMWEAGHRASYGTMRGYEMVVQSLACRLGEEVRFVISPEELERELSVEGADVEDIARKYWTPPYSREACTDRGDAEQARAWLEEAHISEALADSLGGLVDRVGDEARFARENQRVCEAAERNMYGWHPLPEPEGGRPGLPDWFCHWRGALAFVDKDGEEAPLRFGNDETVIEALRGQPVVFRPMGTTSRRPLTDRFRAFPVAWVGADARYALVIRLEDADDRQLYLVDSTRLFLWSFDPWQTPAFESPAHLVDALEGLAEDVEGRLVGCGTEPPSVKADIGEFEEMSAAQAREYLAQAELDKELAGALARLVDGFEELSFHREDDRRLEFYEVINQARFPAWYRRWRTALAHPMAPDKSAAQTKLELRFRPGSFQARQGYGDKQWTLSPPGVHQDHLRHRLIDRYGAVPIGYETYDVLAIRLDGSDRAIYTFDPTLFGADEDFDPFESRAFEGPAELIDAIEAVGTSSAWVERKD